MNIRQDFSRIAVILVEPIYGGNVGAIARIMHNFCFSDLRIVGKVPEKNDFYLAMHSEEILENVNTYSTLEDAINGLDRVIAFSRRLGKNKPVDFTPGQMAKYVHSLPDSKIGLVFGRETYGLTDSEAELCPLRCHFMANPSFPSLNLAQAVALALWEIYSLPWEEKQKGKKYYNSASGKELDEIRNYILEVMRQCGFFQRRETINWDAFLAKMLAQLNPDKNMLYRLRQMFNRFNVLVTGKGLGYELPNSDLEKKENKKNSELNNSCSNASIPCNPDT
jgi:TrmH family RNA methyltransferase